MNVRARTHQCPCVVHLNTACKNNTVGTTRDTQVKPYKDVIWPESYLQGDETVQPEKAGTGGTKLAACLLYSLQMRSEDDSLRPPLQHNTLSFFFPPSLTPRIVNAECQFSQFNFSTLRTVSCAGVHNLAFWFLTYPFFPFAILNTTDRVFLVKRMLLLPVMP